MVRLGGGVDDYSLDIGGWILAMGPQDDMEAEFGLNV